MFKKSITLIILTNLGLYIWQTILSISLSTQGDTLSESIYQIRLVKNQIDQLKQETINTSSLTYIYPRVVSKGFIPVEVVSFKQLQLASARLK